ncbi:hypothetical protein BD410DRAFT_854709 [Rickenella mellea]|uniref:Uncharacterized protein n=1 Tax=Rickenella mellea TaxID=50990 RepID=A0A4Y7PK07_9AGAM|nr:hypothetical protein BD410DRAFT_854709 [Rickenella mellea]
MESNLERTVTIPRGSQHAPSAKWLQDNGSNRKGSKDETLTNKATERKPSEVTGMPRGGVQVPSAGRIKTGDAASKVTRNGAAPGSTTPFNSPASSTRPVLTEDRGIPDRSATTLISEGALPKPWRKTKPDEKQGVSSSSRNDVTPQPQPGTRGPSEGLVGTDGDRKIENGKVFRILLNGDLVESVPLNPGSESALWPVPKYIGKASQRW